jgi:uncharacterized protein YlzI (FlbEa/FlbD family)
MIRPPVIFGDRFNECKRKLWLVVKHETDELVDKVIEYLRDNYKSGRLSKSNRYVLKTIILMNGNEYNFEIIYLHNDEKIKLAYFDLTK